MLYDMYSCIDAGLYYPALLIALTMPELCISLTLERDKFIKDRHYIAFIETYADIAQLQMSAKDCYRLRGGVVHRGNATAHPYSGKSVFIFGLPEGGPSISAEQLVVDGVEGTMVDLLRFCNAIELAVHNWFHNTSAQHREISKSSSEMLTYYPNGYPRFVLGKPVLACNK